MAYVAYHVDDWREDGVPIAAGNDKAEVQAVAIRRILSLGVVHGQLAVQEREDLADIIDDLRAKLDQFFAERGIEP